LIDLMRQLNAEGRLSPEDRQRLVFFYELLSELQLEHGHAEQSVDTLREALTGAPDPIVRIELASSLLKSGHPTEAARELEQGWAALDIGTVLIPERQLGKAKALALSHTLASSLERPLTDSQRRAHAGDSDRAISELREVIRSGYGKIRMLRTEPAFAGIRKRPDFQMLMMDLAFPKEVFAP
jgi:hypothetical protein